jgi:branched-chain amino acid transport system ATP-binding protein
MRSSRTATSKPSTSAPGAPDGALLRAIDLTSGYGSTTVLWGVSLEVRQGEVVALVGRNGMGKTTLMRALMGLVAVWSGAITFGDDRVDQWSPTRRARSGIGYIPQGREVFASLTVEENLRMGDHVSHDRPGRTLLYERVYEMFPILKERRTQKAGTLSGGQQQMLAIGRALIGSPDLLLLDEPSEGLQPSIVEQIEHHVQALKDGLGLTIFLVEQNCQLIKNVADRCYVLEQGAITGMLLSEELRRSNRLEECLAL